MIHRAATDIRKHGGFAGRSTVKSPFRWWRSCTGLVFLILVVLVSAVCAESDGKSCPTLDACIKTLVDMQVSGPPFTREESAAVRRVRKFGKPAIPLLIPLLKHPDTRVQQRAGRALDEMSGFTKSDIRALMDITREGSHWTVIPIAEGGSEEDLRTLYMILKSQNWLESIVLAFDVAGEKGLPLLLEKMANECCCYEGPYTKHLQQLFSRIGEGSRPAVQPLKSIALDKTKCLESRKKAVQCLGYIGTRARVVRDDLKNLAKDEPEGFEKIVSDALKEIKDENWLQQLVKKLDDAKDASEIIIISRDIAQMGIDAREAGEVVLKYLKYYGTVLPVRGKESRGGSDSWGVHVAASRTLGYIGYTPAVPALEAALSFDADWRLNWAAAESLGMLKSTSSMEKLRKVAATHWYKPVRDAADRAIRIIEGKPEPEDNQKYVSFGIEYFRYTWIAEWWNPIERCGPEAVYQETISLPVADGALVGTDNGEWGGELAFVGKGGDRKVLLSDNVGAILQTSEGIVVITGLGHLSLRYGSVYLARPDQRGVWLVEKRLVLPGFPEGVKRIAGDEILIDTSGGTVILGKGLKLRLVDCTSYSARKAGK